MSLTRHDISLIGAVLYPIIFQREPLLSADRVALLIMEGKPGGYEPMDYVNAIGSATHVNEDLSSFSESPLYHSPEVIRSYLVALKDRLEFYLRENSRGDSQSSTL